MKIINLWAGPGCGKSTTASGLFHLMKLEKFNVELVTEYAKSLTWDERHYTLQDQIYIFAKQNRQLERLKNKVEYVVTDSPLLLGLLYKPDNYYDSFEPFVKEVFNHYNNVNIFLRRVKDYSPIGRNQTEEEAKIIDVSVKNLLNENNIQYIKINADKNAPEKILNLILQNKL